MKLVTSLRQSSIWYSLVILWYHLTVIFQTSEHSSLVNKHYIVGASFEKNSTTAWFNGNPYHSPPLALSLILNVYYKMHFGSERSISFINHPLPFNFNSEVKFQTF
jgi:hypothetical protein